MKAEFKGGRELEQAFRNLDISTARKRGIASRALDKAAVPIRDKWRQGVDVESGDLKRSIKIGNRAQTKATRKFKRGAGQDIVERYIGIDPSEDDRSRLQPQKGSRGYAFIEEFGDENRTANPAGRVAWESKKMEAFDMIGGELWAEIEKTAKREAKKAKV